LHTPLISICLLKLTHPGTKSCNKKACGIPQAFCDQSSN
jgi:hypothetical protein